MQTLPVSHPGVVVKTQRSVIAVTLDMKLPESSAGTEDQEHHRWQKPAACRQTREPVLLVSKNSGISLLTGRT